MRKITVLAIFTLIISLSASKIGTAINVKGIVNLKEKNDSLFKKLSKDAPISIGDIIETKQNSFLAFIYDEDKSLIKIRANSKVEIVNNDEKEKRIKFFSGSAFNKVTKLNKSYIIETVTSVASVKGTEFFINVEENGNTEIICTKGIVELKNLISGTTVDVTAGNSSVSTSDGEVYNSGTTDQGSLDNKDMKEEEKETPNIADKKIPDADMPKEEEKPAAEDKGGVTGSAVVGGTTIGDENYQQIGFRVDIPIGKLGLGLDVMLLIDKDGNIREEDWNDFEDYVDKLYYVRWGQKTDPFYIKIGGIDYSSLGYGIAVNNYSNMIEYPDYKRIGTEIAFNSKDFGGEILINNYKELFTEKPSMLLGTRVYYNLTEKLSIGATFASDFNEYNGLRDSDGDKYPDAIDRYPNEKRYVTEIQKYRDGTDPNIITDSVINELVRKGLIDGTKIEDLPKYADSTSVLSIAAVDLGFSLFKTDFASASVYGQFAQIIDYGWGFSAPGFKLNVGLFDFIAEYRQNSKEFTFGYFNSTYELERATFSKTNDTTITVVKKSDTLKGIEELNGIFSGLSFNAWDYLSISAYYQYLMGDKNLKSLMGEVAIKEKLIPKITTLKAYYMQNNVKTLKYIKTPSTVMGGILGYDLKGGVSLDFNYKFTFKDVNGDGKIKGDNETFKTVEIATRITF